MAESPHETHPRATGPPTYLFWLEFLYLAVLLLLFAAYEESDPIRDFFPRSLGPLPTEVPWFGAVGAVLIGLTGHFFHDADWDATYNRWHISRPLLGAVVGPIGCLILVVVVRAASKSAAGEQPAFYDVVAFLVGYREESFRELIKKATDLILSSGNSPGPGGTRGSK